MAQLTVDDYKAILAASRQLDEAGLYASTVGENPPVRYLTIPLDTARVSGNPFIINFGFKSFVVLNTTDASVQVNMQLGSQDSNVDNFPVKNNASLNMPYPVQKAFLTWTAQSGKTISILFFTKGEFSTNQLVSSISANVNLFDGGSIATQAGGQVLAAGNTLFAADTSRNMMMIQNQSGQSIWLGSSAAVTLPGGAFPGFEVPAGGFYEWRSSFACFAISAADTGATDISLTKFSP